GSLQSDSAELYTERERAETGLGVSEVDRKRHLAAGYAEIGDTRLRQLRTTEAKPAYEESARILSEAAKLGKNEAVANDLVIIRAKISHLWEVAKSSRTVQYTSGRVLTVSGGAGSVREVTVDRGADDGLVVGAEGSALSAYSKTGDRERKVLVIGKSRVTAVGARRATVAITLTDPSGDGLVQVGDVVSMITRVPPLPSRSILWLLAGYHITLVSHDKDRVFNDYRI